MAILGSSRNNGLFISLKTYNLLVYHAPSSVVDEIMRHIAILSPTRYQRRWRRRLRDGFGFSGEDAHQIALATFGIDEQNIVFGVDNLVTTDIRMIERFHSMLPDIEHKFRRMTSHLSYPYSDATLPELSTLAEIHAIIRHQ
jgi:hypothetical protein